MYNFYIILKIATKKSMMHTAKNMHQILSLSNDAYEETRKLHRWFNREKGIYIWTNKNLKSRNLEIKVRKELGIEQNF